jgi:hypothetical protein
MVARWIVLLLVLLTQALAQVPNVPQELLKPRRRLQDDRLVLCVNRGGSLENLERAVATALGKALLVNTVFYEVEYGNFPVFDDGDFLTSLYLDLTNNCDGFLGINMASGKNPDWLTFSRPYLEVPYLFISNNPSWTQLADLPPDQKIGVLVSTAIDATLINYLQTLPTDQQWGRLPYGSLELMEKRLLDGTLGALLLWSPLIRQLPSQGVGLTIGSIRPLPAQASQLGVALRAQDTALRSSIDAALTSLIESGEMTQLIEAEGIQASPGGEFTPTDPDSSATPERNPWLWALLLPILAGIGVGLRLRQRKIRT